MRCSIGSAQNGDRIRAARLGPN